MLRSTTFRYRSFILLLLVVMLASLNVFTPLRITTDSFRYLNIMEYLGGGLGPDSLAAADFYPHGYPYLLLWLERAHALNAAVLVSLNIISVIGSSYLFTRFFPVKQVSLFFAFILMSFINVKHMTLPVADQLFTLFLFGSILCAANGFEKSAAWFIPAIMLAAIAIYLRTAGIVLFAGLALYLLYRGMGRIKSHKHYRLILFVLLILLLAIIAGIVLLPEGKVSYIDQLALGKCFTHPSSIITRLGYHLQEMGEMTINIPASQVMGRLHLAFIPYLFILAGLIVAYMVIRKAIILCLYQKLPFWIFMAYAAMIFVWPYYDTRFLIPLMPFALYCLFPQFDPGLRAGYPARAVAGVFIFLGFVSLCYSAMLSLSKPKFLQYYGNEPKLTNAYKVHFEKRDAGQSSAAHNDRDTTARIIYLLDKYDQ